MRALEAKQRSRSVKVSKGTLWLVFLVFSFMVSFRALIISHFYPVVANIEIAFVLLLGVFMAYWIVELAYRARTRIGILEVLILAFTALPIIGAIASYLEFGQPIILGLVAFKEFFLIYAALLLSYLLQHKIVHLRQVEKAMLISAWISLVYFYGMSLFTDPSSYQDSLLAGAQESKGSKVYYRFSMAFLFFGSIYYWVKAWVRQKPQLLIASFLFLAYIVLFRMDRTSMAFVLFAMALFLVRRVPLKRIFGWTMFALVPTLSLLFLISLASPGSLMNYVDMFANALGTLSGNETQDGASILRQFEWDIAAKYFERNPLIGNGRLTGEWVEGGFDHFFGFFYPGDVGVLGQLFIYGVVGALLLYSQFLLAIWSVIKVQLLKNDIFFLASSYYLLTLFLDSLSNGSLTVYAAQTLTVIAILFHFSKEETRLRRTLKLTATST